MWSLVAAWVGRNKRAIAKAGVAVLVIGGLASAIAVQTLRLKAAELDAREARAEKQELLVALRTASAEATRRAAEAGAEARARYDDKMEAEAGAVDRAMQRIERVCLRDDARVSEADDRSVVDGADAEAGDDRTEQGRGAREEERVFVESLKRDIHRCQAALHRCTALQDWVREACLAGGN